MATKKKDFSAGVRALDKFFTETDPPSEEAIQSVIGATQDAQEAPQTKSQAQDQKGLEEPEKPKKKDTHKVFSFRAEKKEADSWRVWADASGLTVDELGERAIREYIKRHPLKGDQLQIYELKMKK